MNDIRPEWYGRIKKGPFQETTFTLEIKQKVEETLRAGGNKPLSKSLRPWTAVGLITLVLICSIVLYPTLRAHLLTIQPSTSAASQPSMTHGYLKQHLKVGMSEADVLRDFGRPMESQVTIRDFAQPHQENPNDLRTWTKLEIWRYDYGVRQGYKVKSDVNEANGFDLRGITNGDIASQLVIVWKEGKVDRAFYRYGISSAISYIQIGPAETEQHS